MSIEIDHSEHCGPTVDITGRRPRMPSFTVRRFLSKDAVDCVQDISLSPADALAVGKAMIAWARSQGAVST